MRPCGGGLALAAALAACGPGDPGPPPAAWEGAARDSAAAMFLAIPDTLAASGPAGWLTVFEDTPAFLMASDGAVAFPTRDSAVAFLRGFAPTVGAMELTWRDVRITALAPGLAAIAAAYDERIIMVAGDTVAFGGYVTGVARSHDGAWRLQQLHWSSPGEE